MGREMGREMERDMSMWRRWCALAMVAGAAVVMTGCGASVRPELTVKEHPRPRSLQEAVQWETASKSLASHMRLEPEHLQGVDWPCRIKKRSDKNGKRLRFTYDIDYTPRGWLQTLAITASPPGRRAYRSGLTRNTYDGKGRLTSHALALYSPKTGKRMLELREVFSYAPDAGLIARTDTMLTSKITNPSVGSRTSYMWDHGSKRVQESSQAVRRSSLGQGWAPASNPKASRICSFSRHLIGPERCDGKRGYLLQRGVTGHILTAVRPGTVTQRTDYKYDSQGRVTRSVYIPNVKNPDKHTVYEYVYDAEHPQRLVRIVGKERFSALAPPGQIVSDLTYICED